MVRKIVIAVLSVALVGGLTLPARAQSVSSRQVSVADVAAAVLQSNLQLRAAAFHVEDAHALLAQAGAKSSAGASPRFYVLQAEVASVKGDEIKVQPQTGVANAKATLNAALNISLDTPLEPTGAKIPQPRKATLAEAIARALRDRTD